MRAEILKTPEVELKLITKQNTIDLSRYLIYKTTKTIFLKSGVKYSLSRKNGLKKLTFLVLVSETPHLSFSIFDHMF